MLAIFLKTLPFFALIGTGWLAAASKSPRATPAAAGCSWPGTGPWGWSAARRG